MNLNNDYNLYFPIHGRFAYLSFNNQKGFITDLHGGIILKQLNYPIAMLPILFRSVDRMLNDHSNTPYRSCKFTFFLLIQQMVAKKRLTFRGNV